jgi:hypothetical protein
MKTNWLKLASSLTFVAASVPGCGADGLNDTGDSATQEGEEVLGTVEQAWGYYPPPPTYYPTCASASSDPDGDGWGWENNYSCKVATSSGGSGSSGSSSGSSSTCANPEGTHSTMAAVAVAAAQELKRWQPTTDFAIGRVDNAEALVLSSAGRARCSDGICKRTQALLDFQKTAAHQNVIFPGNIKLDVYALRSRMVAKFKDQLSCEMQPSNGGTTNCPVEQHTLTFLRAEKGGCDMNFFFQAKGTNGAPLLYPAQLKNKLKWADTTNPYIGFQNVGDVVSIDPTYGLNEESTSQAGSCAVACVKISTSADVSGQCCSCNNTNRKFGRSLFNPYIYFCQG